MPKRSSKASTDPNVAAFRGVQSWLEIVDPNSIEKPKKKNPAAVARGAKGGKARAVKLPAKNRKAIATKAAKTRWAKQTG
jgi:hypothetical protein